MALDDHGRIGSTDDDRTHLAHDGGEPRLHELNVDWIDINRRFYPHLLRPAGVGMHLGLIVYGKFGVDGPIDNASTERFSRSRPSTSLSSAIVLVLQSAPRARCACAPSSWSPR